MLKGSVFWCISSFFLCLCIAKRDYVLRLLKTDCTALSRDYFESLECHVLKVNGKTLLSSEVHLKKNVSKITTNLVMTVLLPGKPRMKLINVDVDGCAIAELSRRHEYFRIIASYFLAIEPPLECPLQAGIKYILHNYEFPAKELPRYAPEGKASITITSFFDDIPTRNNIIDILVETKRLNESRGMMRG